MRHEIEKLETEMRCQKMNENAEIDQENIESFETAGRQIENIIKNTGDCGTEIAVFA